MLCDFLDDAGNRAWDSVRDTDSLGGYPAGSAVEPIRPHLMAFWLKTNLTSGVYHLFERNSPTNVIADIWLK
jgi:hypothetical protein